MRKECQVIFRLLISQAVLNLAFAAVCGALWKVLENEKAPLIFTGVFLALFLFLIGSYLAVSDTKWMLKRTLYGKTLSSLGDAETLMGEIDKEAQGMEYECAAFALMDHWLVLYQPASPKTWGMAQIQSRPIPVHHIARIGWGRDTNEENGGFWVRLVTTDGEEWETFVWENADIEALRQWSAIREKKEL